MRFGVAAGLHTLLSRRSRALRPPLLVWLLMAGETGRFSEMLALSVELRRVVRKLLRFRAVHLILYLSMAMVVSIGPRG